MKQKKIKKQIRMACFVDQNFNLTFVFVANFILKENL